MNDRIEKIKAAMSDEAFVKACIEAENEEAVQKLFAEKGVEISLTEIEQMKEMLNDVLDGKITEEQLNKMANGGELSEDELEQAAGGVVLEVLSIVGIMALPTFGITIGALEANGIKACDWIKDKLNRW